jgi:hypothetical protein
VNGIGAQYDGDLGGGERTSTTKNRNGVIKIKIKNTVSADKRYIGIQLIHTSLQRSRRDAIFCATQS